MRFEKPEKWIEIIETVCGLQEGITMEMHHKVYEHEGDFPYEKAEKMQLTIRQNGVRIITVTSTELYPKSQRTHCASQILMFWLMQARCEIPTIDELKNRWEKNVCPCE